MVNKMNVIVVFSDTLRRDKVSCYGPTPALTPRLEAFAKNSYVFDQAFIGSFPTVPARFDFFSGRFTHLDYDWCPLPKESVTLQQILGASGIATQMIVDNPHLVEDGFNYERGFGGWEWIRGQESDKVSPVPSDMPLPMPEEKTRTGFVVRQHLRNNRWWKNEEDRFAPRTIQAACRWLEQNQDLDQFFLYVDLFDPHEPWEASENFIKMYDPDYSGPGFIYPRYGKYAEFYTPDEMRAINTMYMAEVSMVDRWFGILLDKVEELGLTEDTAIIFLSDHGLLFGEHGLIGKALMPEVDGKSYYEAMPKYEEIRHIPLIIHLPEQKEAKRIDALVQIPDLMPTILEMSGVIATEMLNGESQVQAMQCGVFYTEHWQFDPKTLHGKSLMPLMRGEINQLHDIVVSSQTLIYPSPVFAKTAIVTQDGWCLHYSGSYSDASTKTQFKGALSNFKLVNPAGAISSIQPELYHMPEDPGEERNQIGENESLAKEIHARYVGWLKEMGTQEAYLQGRLYLWPNGQK